MPCLHTVNSDIIAFIYYCKFRNLVFIIAKNVIGPESQ